MNKEETVTSETSTKEGENNSQTQGTYYLLVNLNREGYFIALSLISKIIHPIEIFPLPDTLDFISGVANLSGEIVPVVDLKKVMKLTDLGQNTDRKFVICKYQNMKVGVVVDKVIDSREIDVSVIKTDTTRVMENQFISGEYIDRDSVIAVVDLVKFIETHRAV